MSSILEALKRMEGAERDETLSSAVSHGAPSGGKARAGRRFLLVALFLVGAAGGAGGVYLASHSDPPLASAEEAPKRESVFRVVAPVSPSVSKPAGPTPLNRPAPPVVSAPAPIKEPAPRKALPVPPPNEAGSGVAAVSEAPPRSGGAPEATAAPAGMSATPGRESSQTLPAADGAIFHLQGVRWSEVPSRRIAVINSQILREGGTLEGARIVTIERDGVRLRVGGELQFLAFTGR